MPAGARSPQWSYFGSLSETLTDNANARGGGETDADQITTATLGSSVALTGGRVKGFLRLSGQAKNYADNDAKNTSYVLGNGNASAELVDDSLFLEVNGSVRRENKSAFQATSVDDSIDSDNRTLIRRAGATLRAPLNLGSGIGGEASLRFTRTSGSDIFRGARRSKTFATNLGDTHAFGDFGWSANFVRQQFEGDARLGDTDVQSIRAALLYHYSPQLLLQLTGGHEKNDYEAGNDQSFYTKGVGATWLLSQRTSIDANVEKRFFGTGYKLGVQHSRPLSSLRLSYVKNVSSIEDATFLSLEEIAYRELFVSLASQIPDPAERDSVARSLAETIPNGATTFASFVTNSFSVSRRLQLTGSLVGARNVLSASVGSSNNERIGSTSGLAAEDDFASFSRIKTRRASLSLTHRLSGKSSLSAAVNVSNSKGSGVSSQDVTRRSLTVGYNTRIGPHTTGAASVRRQRSTGTSEFTENALVVSLSARF